MSQSGGTGELGLLEFHKLLRSLNIPFSLEEVKHLIEERDLNSNGLIDFEEFHSIYKEALAERFQEAIPCNQIRMLWPAGIGSIGNATCSCFAVGR